MGYAVRNLETGWISTWSRYDQPPHDAELEELVTCEAEELDALKPAEQLADEAAPLECTPLQAKLALHRAGFLDAVEQAVEAAGPEAIIAWRNALVFRRKSPLVQALAARIPGLAAALPAIITAAVEIEV